MKTILVTGASGQLGLCLQAVSSNFLNYNFLFKTSKHLDITDVSALKKAFSETRIDWLINCAAYTAVDKAEEEIEKAEKINARALSDLAKLCEIHKTKLIHISTDFVFDGDHYHPYKEDDEASPLNHYGKTKYLGEQEIIKELRDYYIIRTSWVYSEFANNFMKTMLKLSENRKELNVVDDQIGSPTYAKDLADVIMKIVLNDQDKFGIYHYSNEGSTSWYHFAKEIFKIKDISISLNPVTSKEFKTLAIRPKYSVLDKSKIKEFLKIEIPHWTSSLKKAITSYNEL